VFSALVGNNSQHIGGSVPQAHLPVERPRSARYTVAIGVATHVHIGMHKFHFSER
jgi:hypothetical protein